MKFDITFVANALVNWYKADDEKQEIVQKHMPIDLKLSKGDAANFIFRFGSNAFDIQDYHVVMKYNEVNELFGIALINKDNDIFVVVNMNSFLAQITEGYVRARTTEKITAMMEFDFEAYSELGEIPDEFDFDKKNPEEV